MENIEKKAPTYSFAHLGINPTEDAGCADIVELFAKAFGFPSFDVGNSVIVAGPLELPKSPGPGRNGHIGIETDDVDAAMEDLAAKGFHFEESTLTRLPDGTACSVYLTEPFAGFAVHLLRKRQR